MDRKEFERIKQAEKEHLRALKKIKRKLHEAQRMQKLREAMQNIDAAGTSNTYDEMLGKLEQETIEQEVRLDMALEGQEDLPELEPEVDEATLRAQKAAELVRQMKLSMGALDESDEEDEDPEPAGPEKTIGRMKPDEEEDEIPETPRAEKTIGRARRRSAPEAEDEDPDA